MTQFMPHGMCYLWEPGLLWLHVVSDAVIAVSYFTIPLALLYIYQRKRHDLPFHWMFLFFATFIVACGATHVMNIWTVWNPDYWLSGGVKVVTAIASLGTAALLVPMLPKVVELKDPRELEQVNEELEAANFRLAEQVAESRRAQEEVRRREKQLAEAQAIARLGSWEWEVDDDRVVWSDELYRLYGLEPGSVEITFDEYLRRVHPEDRDRVAKSVAEALAGGRRFDFEERIVRPDGSVRILRSKGYTLVDESGRARRMVGTCHDVTDTRRAEEARSESELRYRAIFDQTFGFVVVLDPGGVVLDVNQASLEAGGLRVEDVLGTALWEAGWWCGVQGEREVLERAIERALEGEVVREERPYRAAGGELRRLDRSVKSVRGPEGEVRFLVLEGRDVTEQKQAERSVRLLARSGEVLGSSLDFDTLLDQVAELVVEDMATICFLDLLDGDRLERAACAHSDRARTDVFEGLVRHVPDLEREDHPIVRVVTEGRTAFVPRVDDDWLEEVTLDAEHADFLRALGFDSFVSVPLVARGEILGALTCTRTPEAGRSFSDGDRRILEELGRRIGVALDNARLYAALRDSEEQFRRMVETANEGIWTIDADEVTSYVNERMASLLGYTVEEMLGRPLYDFMDIDAREEARRNVERRREGVQEQHEFRLRRRDGSAVWTYMSTSPLTDDSGRYVGALAMVTDITALKEAAESLRASEERYRFLADHSTDMITRHAADGTCTYASPSAEEITGFRPDELVGRQLGDILRAGEEDEEEARERRAEAFESTEPHAITGRIRRKDGEIRWVEASYRAIRDEESGKMEALLAVTRDVSDRVRETRLVGLLQQITAHANEAVTARSAIRSSLCEIAEFMEWPLAHAWVVSDVDPDVLEPTGIWYDSDAGGFEAFREATENATFERGETLPGRTMETRGPEWIPDVRDDPGFTRIRDLEEPGVVAAFALPVVTEGRTLAVLEFFHDREAEPERRLLEILADAGHQLGQRILREQAEGRLREREAQLEEAQRIARLGSWTRDLREDRREWSRETYRIFGFDPARSFETREVFERIHDEDRERVEEAIRRTIRDGEPFRMDYRIRRPDGEIRFVHGQGQVVRDEDGEPVRMIGTVQDITERKRIEERLQRSEEDYRMLAEHASDLILRFTPEGVVTYASPAIESMVGYEPEEVVGRHASEFVHSEDLEQVVQTHRALLKEEGSRSVLFRMRSRDGELLWIESTSRAVRDPDSEWVRSIVAISRDVTESVETARTVRLLERIAALANKADTSREAMRAALKLICEHAGWPVGHAYVQQRAAGGGVAPLHLWHVEDPERYRELRERAPALGMAAARGLPGRVLESGRPEWVDGIVGHPDYPALADVDDLGVRSALAFPVESGSETLAVLEFFSPRVEEVDDALVDTMRHVGSNLGQVVRRQRAEEALRASEMRFRALAESASDAIVTANEEGRIVYVNDSIRKIFGHRVEDLVGRPLKMLMPERLRGEHEAAFQRFLETREPRLMGTPTELVGLHKDGSEIPVELSLGWWESEEGVFFTGVLRDITDRKRVEEALNEKMEELARSNSELALFTYVASHDLREPLRTVGSNVQLVARRLGEAIEDANLRKSIDFALGGVRRMQELIDDLLVYSRVGTEGSPFERVDLDDVVDEAAANLRTAFEEADGVLERQDELPRVLADRSQLVQLLQNLLSNALKYRSEGEPPRIRITAERGVGEWTFSVSDNGIGVPPEFAEHVFTIFQRLHSESEIPGTGIGLAVCRKIVERHGGRIWVESDPGEGATFRFTLPAR